MFSSRGRPSSLWALQLEELGQTLRTHRRDKGLLRSVTVKNQDTQMCIQRDFRFKRTQTGDKIGRRDARARPAVPGAAFPSPVVVEEEGLQARTPMCGKLAWGSQGHASPDSVFSSASDPPRVTQA